MPKYPGALASNVSPAQAPAQIAAGESVYLFGVPPSGAVPPPYDSNVVGEAFTSATAPQASVAFSVLGRSERGAPAVCFEIRFSAAPGAFEIDIQEADTDADNFYIMPTASSAYKVTAVNATTFIARVDLIPTGGKFMRVFLVSLTNSVSLIVKASALN